MVAYSLVADHPGDLPGSDVEVDPESDDDEVFFRAVFDEVRHQQRPGGFRASYPPTRPSFPSDSTFSASPAHGRGTHPGCLSLL